MITIETLCVRYRGLTHELLQHWIELDWVRADGGPGQYLFQEIDAARVGLILELREQLQLGEEALPVVLSLLDQLYEERRRMRRVLDALDRAGPSPLREQVLRHLAGERA